MKELSIEEKAKAYDEALERASNLHKDAVEMENNIVTETCEIIFPELKESEDEKIRKDLIRFIKGCFPDETSEQRKTYLAWLEKQDEKPQGKSVLEAVKEEKVDNQNCVKPVDEVEHKFKVGDKIRRKLPSPFDKDMQVARIDKDYYVCNHIGKFSCEVVPFSEQSSYELIPAWSEEDDEMAQVAINACNSYQDSLVRSDSRFDKAVKAEDWLKSLKDRVQPKQEWSKEDEDNFKHLMDEIVCLGNSRNSAERLHYDRLIKFLDELKNRVQPREEWCDKDERMLDRLIAYFEKRVAFTDDDNPRYANWLKSLRPQNHWKPSDEQMKVLDVAIKSSHLTTAEYDGLVKLSEQLKKL